MLYPNDRCEKSCHQHGKRINTKKLILKHYTKTNRAKQEAVTTEYHSCHGKDLENTPKTLTMTENVLPVGSRSLRVVLCFWCIQFWIGSLDWLAGLGVLKCSSQTQLSTKQKKKKTTGINQDEQRNKIIVSLYYNQSNWISMRLSVTTE